MRGVLACAVMLFHLGLNTLVGSATGGWVTGGVWPLCVDFFFLLSGFVLSLSYQRRPVSLAEFARKRLLRLAPMYLATTGIMILLTVDPQALVVLANLLMLQPLFGLPSINMPAWSVPFEAWLPLAALLVVPALPRFGRPVQLAALVLALAAQCWATFDLARGVDHQLWRAASGLLAGALMQRLYRPGLGSASGALALFAAGVAIMALAGIAPVLALAFPLCSAAAIWLGAQARGLFSTAPFQALGRWSFSIYLIHIPVLVAAERLFGSVDGRIALKIAIVLVVLALSAAGFRWIESPFMAMGRPVKPATA